MMLDDFHWKLLIEKGLASPGPMAEAIERREAKYVIYRPARLRPMDEMDLKDAFTGPVADAILKNYQFATVAGPYVVAVPRPG